MTQKLGRNRYHEQLLAELDALFPSWLFRGLPKHANENWDARKVVWMSLIMFWVSGKTLNEQFSAARRIVKFIRPGWKVPVSYSGFVDAQVRWWPLIQRLLILRLRPDESIGSAWRVRGWLTLAVDGSRFECPRTTSNKDGLGCAGREKTARRPRRRFFKHYFCMWAPGCPGTFVWGPAPTANAGTWTTCSPSCPSKRC